LRVCLTGQTGLLTNMRERLKILLSLLLYWMAFFGLARIMFLCYNYPYTANLSPIEILKSMAYGMKMDISMTGYIIILSGLIITLSVFTAKRWVLTSLHVINLLFALLFCLVIIVDLELYRHWGFRMNITPFFYMGSEAAGTAEFLTLFSLLILGSLFSWLFIALYRKKIIPACNTLKPGAYSHALAILLASGLMFFPIRGSIGTSTMNVGKVYYHKTKMFANHAGINVVWNFLYSLQNDNAIKYPEDLVAKELTELHFKELYPAQDTTFSVLHSHTPNILLIILESFTADVIEPLGGIPGVTPNLNALCKEGILFDQFYANGDRTDKGLVSLLASFPAQPKGSIIKYPQKTQNLAYLSVKLEELGYHTSFVYGGDADFANYRSFLTNGRFAHITSDEHFSSSLSSSKWGVHDEYVFTQALSELDTTTGKFFKTILTLSSHEPYDVPIDKVFVETGEEALFLNSCHYTDKALGEFISEARKKPWWNNTLIIITADHGHRLPGNKRYETKEKFRIPMLWIGGAIKGDTIIRTVGSHTDLANTVLAQLDKPSADFIFSKNMLGAPVKDFAIYVFNDGYGYLDPSTYFVYDNPGKQYIRKEGVEDEHKYAIAKAYIQKLYLEYNAKK
jgi:phosphoglycerol transferase MdoB-like AlkP superfamily enzyme